MCHNFLTGRHINFILGSQHEDDPPTSEGQVRRKMVAIATTVA